jgi:hypothetical protein
VKAGEDNAQMALAKNLAGPIDVGDMLRNRGKTKSGPKKKKPGTALADLTNPVVRTPAPMPPIRTLAALTRPQRQAFKRLAAKLPGSYARSEFSCITDTADALIAAKLAEKLGNEYRRSLGAPALGDVLMWFQLNHVDSRVHYPLGIVKARKPGDDDHSRGGGRNGGPTSDNRFLFAHGPVAKIVPNRRTPSPFARWPGDQPRTATAAGASRRAPSVVSQFLADERTLSSDPLDDEGDAQPGLRSPRLSPSQRSQYPGSM